MQNNPDMRTRAMHLTKFEAVDALLAAWQTIEALENQLKEIQDAATRKRKRKTS